MATCPRCYNALSARHRCSVKAAFRRASHFATIGTAGIGIGSAATMLGGGGTPLLAVVSTLATVVLHAAAKELSLI